MLDWLEVLAFEAKVRSARLALAVEAVWPAAARAIAATLVFTGLGLLGLWAAIPGWLHLIALASFIIAIGFCARWAFALRHWPTRTRALARLERDAGLAHQPLRTSDAQPATHTALANPGDVQAALWHAHIQRLQADKAVIAPATPKVHWARREVYATSALLMLCFAAAFGLAGANAPHRIASSFVPDLRAPLGDIAVSVVATPPAYTGKSAMVLTAIDPTRIDPASITLPAGTALDITVTGARRAPSLQIAGTSAKLEDTGAGQHKINMAAPQADGFTVMRGSQSVFSWAGPFISDQPPVVRFADLPKSSANDALAITYEAGDDYGVVAITLDMAVTAPSPQQAGNEPAEIYNHAVSDAQAGRFTLDLPLPGAQSANALPRRTAYQDLAKSPWAGRMVEARLMARDGLEQTGWSEAVRFILPQRAFAHPIAREVMSARTRLFFEANVSAQITAKLDMLSRQPDAFGDDLWVFAMLRSSVYRLGERAPGDLLDDITEQLWQIAVWLEDGGVSAERDAFRAAMDEMMNALSEENDSAFEALAQELEAKLADLMRAQMEQLTGAQPPTQMDGGQMRMVDDNTLQRMMQQMRDLAAAGDSEGAMAMLEAIQSLMENLQASQGPSEEALQQAQAAQDALDALSEMIDTQRDLMNQTVQEAMGAPGDAGQGLNDSDVQQGQQGAQGQPGQSGDQNGGQQGQGGMPDGNQAGSKAGRETSPMQALANQQRGLAAQGAALAKELGEAGLTAPEGLTGAQQNLQGAAQQLSRKRALRALRQQADALRKLQDAQGDMEGQMEQMMQQMQQQSAGRDPMGRPSGNGTAQGQVKIPTQAEATRARAIRQELQRRLSDPARSPLERTYLRRLLERFSR